MSIIAKVKVEAVEKFRLGVNELSGFYPKVSRAIDCVGLLREYAQEKINELNELIPRVNASISHTEDVISQLENSIDAVENVIQICEDKLNKVRSEISYTPSTCTYEDSDGNSQTCSNPEYEALCDMRDSIEDDLIDLQRELQALVNRKNKAASMPKRLRLSLEEINDQIDCLTVILNNCDRNIQELSNIKDDGEHKSKLVSERLSVIKALVDGYLAIPFDINSFSDMPTIDNDDVYVVTQLKKEYLDDNGKKYREGKKLLPNSEFEIRGYRYVTDTSGNVISAEGKLRLRDPDYKRNMEMVNDYEDQEYCESDDKGHLIGHQFGGSDRLENLVPMSSKLNQIDYALLENYLADALKDGAEVYLKVEVIYAGGSNRPVGFIFQYNIDGEYAERVFRNERDG